MESEPKHPRPIQLLLSNRGEALATPPAPEHYPHDYLWDSYFSAIVFARFGYSREAVTELFNVFNNQRPDGFIPNMQFAANGRRWDMERFSFNSWENSSEYTQPPLGAVSVAETYTALKKDALAEANLLLDEIYPSLKDSYQYFIDQRQNSPTDPLIGIIHPHETGRDSDPIFDFAKTLRWPRNGEATNRWIDRYNTVADYAGAMAINLVNKASRWDLAKSREHFWVNDIMLNCIYVDNLYEMATLARDAGQFKDMGDFYMQAQRVEQQLLSRMWFSETQDVKGAFYALGPDGPIKEVSIGNLFPLILPNLKESQLESTLNLMDSSFNTPFPLPSVATDSPNYDPHYQEKGRLWRGPTWINTNWYLTVRGLKRQASKPSLNQHRPDLVYRCLAWSDQITAASQSLVERGYYEFYDPITGQGQRVKDFSWSTLADTM
ncbi:hypothetical protein KW801_01520 [Candidatus Saccharibacteria bacterium]|nr:hypothetical protein [Candidatus Saccharibacteria bacterium]